MQIVLTSVNDPPLAERPVEVVERKGLGHPDTLCDALAEEVSRGLCRFYRERFGQVLHHNVDKVLLVGGQSAPVFGGGEVTAPIELYLSGRATLEVGGVRVPLDEIVHERCRSWLRAHMRHLDPERHVRLHSLVRGGSSELVDLFQRRTSAEWIANDSSSGAGFAPLTPLEQNVLYIERAVRASAYAEHPERGEDVKLMAVRQRERVDYTVADAFVAKHISSKHAYLDAREALRQDVAEWSGADSVVVNAADDPERDAIYLTVTGTSAEAGDDGEAGRGNRHGGLITPYRPMTMESVAGKNPVSHVGKIYNVLAARIAVRATQQVPALRSLECHMVSRIGAPVSQPQLVHARCYLAPGSTLRGVEEAVRAVIAEQLSALDALCEDFIEGRVPVA